MNPSDWIALGELLVAIIGVIVGCIGGKELKEANKLKIQIGNLKSKIENLEVSNSQIARVINNNGIDLKDADYLVNKAVNEKTINKPDVIYSKEEPCNQKNRDVWIKPV